VQITIEWDEYLALKILKVKRKNKDKLTSRKDSEVQKKYLRNIIDGRHLSKSHQVEELDVWG
jgi:hypothetical protein